jgi:uncharacterized membrane protein YgcG
MTKRKGYLIVLVFVCITTLVVPPCSYSQGSQSPQVFKAEELDQLLAPIALHPDDLLAQILMAATYPLEVVQAARWVKANQNLKGNQLTAALEKQDWDPSVKSLVNFSQVLQMMSDKLDWTQKLGDAVLAQQKDVMDTVQRLRKKAYDAGNLKSTNEQVVKVDTAYQAAQPSGAGEPVPPTQPAAQPPQEVIVIQPANPQVVYVPAYNPTVVYGAWWYPAYPPYPVYPPGYVAGAAFFSFAAGVAVGAAWGYAWGGCNWGHGDINVNVNRNTTINNNIDRSKYQNKITTGQGGQGQWKHNPENRKGVAYRDQATAQQYNRGASPNAQTRENYRGRAETGRQDQARGDRPQGQDRDRPQQRPETGGIDRGAAQQPRENNAFQSSDRGNQTKDFSSRGNQSLASERRAGGTDRASSGMSRGGGGARGGGGGRGGGRR